MVRCDLQLRKSSVAIHKGKIQVENFPNKAFLDIWWSTRENKFRRNVIAYKIEYSCKVLLKMEAFTCVSWFAVILKEMKCNGNPRWCFFYCGLYTLGPIKVLKGIYSSLCVHSKVDKEGRSNIYAPTSHLLNSKVQHELGHAFFHYQLLLDDFFLCWI